MWIQGSDPKSDTQHSRPEQKNQGGWLQGWKPHAPLSSFILCTLNSQPQVQKTSIHNTEYPEYMKYHHQAKGKRTREKEFRKCYLFYGFIYLSYTCSKHLRPFQTLPHLFFPPQYLNPDKWINRCYFPFLTQLPRH